MAQDRIGIIGAMEVEVKDLQAKMSNTEVAKHGATTFVAGELEGVPVVVLQCGIGKVNAAMGAQALFDFYDVSAVINTGIAGAIGEGLKVLDVVVSKDAMWYDFDLRPLGYELGQVPNIATRTFLADAHLRDVAAAAARKAMPESNVVAGRIVSGDRFVNDAKTKTFLADELDGACCEMEGAAIAQVAVLNEVPYVIMRVISDNADGSPAMDYEKMEPIAAAKSTEVICHMLASLA